MESDPVLYLSQARQGTYIGLELGRGGNLVFVATGKLLLSC